MNLIEGLQKEMQRVRELKAEYDALPGGVGFFGSATMKVALERTDKAIADSDVVAELRCYEELKTITG